MTDPTHGEALGYIRGRIDGHENRISSLETGIVRIGDRLDGQDQVMKAQTKDLLDIKMMLSNWMAKGSVLTGIAGVMFGVLIAAIEGHWWIFK